ncbi:early boundary activity protein 2-like [Bactrocera oleae]|uniref:early boundary activity protein 2 n=1 Tax=Bactrocera oleae TaxID=104688 RepID=UPI00387ECAED
MDLSTKSNINLENVNKLTESPLDLRRFPATSNGSFGQGAEFRNHQQTGNELSSVADRQLKRRRNFEMKFIREAKKLKLDETITPVQKETPRPIVVIPKVQTPPNINILDSLVQLLLTMSKAPVSTNLKSVLPYPMSIDIVENSYRKIPAIKKEPAFKDDLVTSNTLTTGNSLIETSSSSLLQPVLVRTHNPHISEGINIKQEPTDQENISPNVTNIHHHDVSAANEESSDVQIGPHGTRVSKVDLIKINVTEASIATRQLMSFIFDRQTLATHTLSGKPSPAFLNRNRPLKAQLDPLKVADAIYYLRNVRNFPEREIRNAITMKCADTAKAIKRRSLPKANLNKLL